MDEEDLRVFMRHPNTMVACDSGLRVFKEGVPHPRGYGNNPRVLARYVREQGVLRLEDAVRKKCSACQQTLFARTRELIKGGQLGGYGHFQSSRSSGPGNV